MNQSRRAVTVLAALLCGWMAPAQAADYCCACKGQTAGKTIDANSRAMAVGQCTLECGAFTNVTSGKCVAPPAAPTAAPAASSPPTGSMNVVQVYKSGDCSGDPVRVTGSTVQLEKGFGSFQVDSGAPASAWENPSYAGRHTEFVGPSICVSPGFDIQSVKLK